MPRTKRTFFAGIVLDGHSRRGLRLKTALMIAVAVCLAAFAGPNAVEDPAQSAGDGNTVRLALLRGVPAPWQLEANFGAFRAAVAMAARQNAQIFITPEGWLDGYASQEKESTADKMRSVAQDLTASDYLRQVSELARALRMYICFGFTSLEGGRVYNAAGLWDAEGRLVGVYHKTHLQRHDLQYTPGDSLPVWPSPWGVIGMMICADRRWPETTRVLRLQGARLILNPTYGLCDDLNEAMMRTRAWENQCFIAFAHPRQSLVTAPNGRIVGKEDLGDGDAKANPIRVLVCTVDLTEADDQGERHLADRRPELYQTITETQWQPPVRTASPTQVPDAVVKREASADDPAGEEREFDLK